MNNKNWKLVKNVVKNLATIWLVFVVCYYGRFVVMNGLTDAFDELELNGFSLFGTILSMAIVIVEYPLRAFVIDIKKLCQKEVNRNKNVGNKGTRKVSNKR